MSAHLIVIQGAPGSGKTTLAENLSRRLSYPIVSKDTLKEALGESLTVTTVADSVLIGKAAIAAMYAATSIYLTSDRSCIIESAFVAEFADHDMKQLLQETGAAALQLYCSLAEEERVRRFNARYASGSRHTVHVDALRIGDETDVQQKYRPLDLENSIYLDTMKPVDENEVIKSIAAFISDL